MRRWLTAYGARVVCSPYLGPQQEVAGLWEGHLGGDPLRQRLAPPPVAAVAVVEDVVVIVVVVIVITRVRGVGGRVDGQG
jgi:hypothetical protein